MYVAYLGSRICEEHPNDGKTLADKILEIDKNIKASEKGLARNGSLKSELDKIVLGYRAGEIFRLVDKDITTINIAIELVAKDPGKAKSLFTYDPEYKENIEKKIKFYGISKYDYNLYSSDQIEEKIAVYLKKGC